MLMIFSIKIYYVFVVVFSHLDGGELYGCEMGHQSTGRLHLRQGPCLGPHHHHRICTARAR